MSDFTFEIVAECFRDSTRVKSLLENIINSRLVRSFAGTWPVDRVTMSLGVNFIVRKLFRRRFKIFSHITHLGVAWRGKESPDRWKRDKYREKWYGVRAPSLFQIFIREIWKQKLKTTEIRQKQTWPNFFQNFFSFSFIRDGTKLLLFLLILQFFELPSTRAIGKHCVYTRIVVTARR